MSRFRRFIDRLDLANRAEAHARAETARREEAEAAWRAELAGLGDRIARAIIADADAHALAGPGRAAASDRAAAVARRVAAEAVVTLPDHSITAPAEPPAGRHRSQADQR